MNNNDYSFKTNYQKHDVHETYGGIVFIVYNLSNEKKVQ
jgi:hypothetical protein